MGGSAASAGVAPPLPVTSLRRPRPGAFEYSELIAWPTGRAEPGSPPREFARPYDALRRPRPAPRPRPPRAAPSGGRGRLPLSFVVGPRGPLWRPGPPAPLVLGRPVGSPVVTGGVCRVRPWSARAVLWGARGRPPPLVRGRPVGSPVASGVVCSLVLCLPERPVPASWLAPHGAGPLARPRSPCGPEPAACSSFGCGACGEVCAGRWVPSGVRPAPPLPETRRGQEVRCGSSGADRGWLVAQFPAPPTPFRVRTVPASRAVPRAPNPVPGADRARFSRSSPRP